MRRCSLLMSLLDSPTQMVQNTGGTTLRETIAPRSSPPPVHSRTYGTIWMPRKTLWIVQMSSKCTAPPAARPGSPVMIRTFSNPRIGEKNSTLIMEYGGPLTSASDAVRLLQHSLCSPDFAYGGCCALLPCFALWSCLLVCFLVILTRAQGT